jgi:hypothetical protein
MASGGQKPTTQDRNSNKELFGPNYQQYQGPETDFKEDIVLVKNEKAETVNEDYHSNLKF